MTSPSHEFTTQAMQACSSCSDLLEDEEFMALLEEDLKEDWAKVGDVVLRDFDRVCGRVTQVLENVKNGEPGVDFTSPDGLTWWAYKSQVTNLSRP